MIEQDQAVGWDVVIIERKGDREIRRFFGGSRTSAETAERGVNINMNHLDFYTKLVPAGESID